MDKPIQVGDLVVVVRPNSCGCAHSVGSIFKVDYIQDGPNYCSGCGMRFANELDAWEAGSKWSASVACLKRIPPLDEKELRDAVMEMTT